MFNQISGPAPAGVTDKIYKLSTEISEYLTCPDLQPEIHVVGTREFDIEGNPFTLQILDPVQDYLEYMKEIFDFPSIRDFLSGAGGKPPLKVIMNALHGGRLKIVKTDLLMHEFHETCHSVTFIVLVNSHQR